MQTAIVFGGSGFLGSHVADALTGAGFAVRLFDRAPSRHAAPGQEMMVGDLLDPAAVARACEGADVVYNFAGIADIEEARAAPLDTARANILGNLLVMEAARCAGVRRFVFASTVYVYSRSGAFYRVSKQACEQFIDAYREEYGLEYTILRYGSLYGRRADARNSIWRMVHEALTRRTITYTGNPDSVREYIHVDDAARLSVEILAPEYRNRHLVLTGTERLAVRDLMRIIAEMMPFPVELRFEPDGRTIHYSLTPYRFDPQVGHKLIARDFVDIGQGLLDCLAEAHQRLTAAGPDDGGGTA